MKAVVPACTHLSVLFYEGPKLGQQEKVDFRKLQAAASLASSAISQKWEGVVLKSVRGPYVLKKVYIPGLADSAEVRDNVHGDDCLRA